jgi:4a-hydroxytetrahydrobiopterin dehydratase
MARSGPSPLKWEVVDFRVFSMTSCELTDSKCVPCHGGEPAATPEELAALMPQIPNWCQFQVNGEDRIEQVYLFENFQKALDFTNGVGAVAEQEEHHPALLTEWGRVTVTWWTHAVGGLHRNDVIMAAKTDHIAIAHGSK